MGGGGRRKWDHILNIGTMHPPPSLLQNKQNFEHHTTNSFFSFFFKHLQTRLKDSFPGKKNKFCLCDPKIVTDMSSAAFL